MGVKFRVTMFGEFSIEYGESFITDQSNRSKKVWTLLEYLIVHRKRFVSQDELIELLWSESNSRDPINTLKVLMHRVRATLNELDFENSRQMILYSHGAYGWNPEFECETDVDEFQRLIRQSELETENDDRRLELLLKVQEIYKGHFLQKKATETWVIPLASYYRSLYTKVIQDASALLFRQKKFEKLVDLCRRAIIFEPYDEKLYIYLIQALIQTGQMDKALELYHTVSELFLREFGISPSEELSALYKEVVKTVKSPEMNIEAIKAKLDESDNVVGCYFCEYEFFKMVYRLQARTVARTGEVIFIILLSISDANDSGVPTQKILNRGMDALKATIQCNLRSGDLFTRYSVNQFLVMLPLSSEGTVNMVAQRIMRAFRKDYPNIPVHLRYSAQQLTPKGMK